MARCGFILAWMVLKMITPAQILPLLGTFSFAWLLGLVVPGAPGGLGVFEATAIALFDTENFPDANVLVTVAIYRLISILSEVLEIFFYQCRRGGSFVAFGNRHFFGLSRWEYPCFC